MHTLQVTDNVTLAMIRTRKRMPALMSRTLRASIVLGNQMLSNLPALLPVLTTRFYLSEIIGALGL